MDEKVHVYIRDPKGRIVTHFLVEGERWEQYEQAARLMGLTMDQFISKAIRDALDHHSEVRQWEAEKQMQLG